MADQLTSAGLEIDDLETRTAALIAEIRSRVAAVADLSTESPMGNIVRILAEREQAAFELLQAVHAGQYPSTAEGYQLDALALLTGTVRRNATKSTVELICTVTTGTYVAGSLIANVNDRPDDRFVSVETLVAAADGSYLVDFESENTGPVQGPANEIQTISEPVIGWSSVNNTADAIPGLDQETDAELRVRRLDEVTIGGSSTVDAIRADLLNIAGVVWCLVLENPFDYAYNGIPFPHAIAVSIYAPTVDVNTIAEAIFRAKPAGILAYGTTVLLPVYDDQGQAHPIGFTEATERPIYIHVHITTDPDTYPGDADFEDNIATAASAYFGVGEDIVYSWLLAECFATPGILDVTEFYIGFSGAPTGEVNLTIDWDEIGIFSASTISTTAI